MLFFVPTAILNDQTSFKSFTVMTNKRAKRQIDIELNMVKWFGENTVV